MKNLLLTTGLCLVSLFAFAQSSNSTLDSVYYSSTYQDTIAQYYQYNDQNQVTEIFRRNKDLPFTFQSRIRYEYAENKTIETIENWLITAQRWENKTQTIKEFNTNDSLVKETFLEWNMLTEQFEISQFIDYEYDNQGNLIRKNNTDYLEYLWQYNDQNQLIEYKEYRLDDSLNRLELKWTITNDYDDNNRLISEIENGLVSTKQAFYTYDNKNRIDTKIDILIYENDTTYNTLTEYFYNHGTNNISKTVTGGNTTFYTYDHFGNLTEIKTQQLHPLIRDIVLEYYVYNEDNLLIERHIFVGYGYTMELFSYDENGDIKTYDYYLCDQFCGNGSNESHWVYFRSDNSNLEDKKETINCLFPNPYTNFQQITCEELAPEKIYDLMVVNIAGQEVYKTKFAGRNGFFINRQLDKGWYVFVVLEDGEIVTKQKILVF